MDEQSESMLSEKDTSKNPALFKELPTFRRSRFMSLTELVEKSQALDRDAQLRDNPPIWLIEDTASSVLTWGNLQKAFETIRNQPRKPYVEIVSRAEYEQRLKEWRLKGLSK